jgi:hypothetical protein
MKLWHKLSPLALLPLALLAAPAQAQLTLNLNQAAQVGAIGDTLNFTGTLSNPTTDTVFLNSESFSFSGPATDASPFLISAPLILDPMGTTDANNNPTDSYTGGFFDVTLDPSVAPGLYTGTVSIIGGAGAFATDTVATHDFSVTVLPAAVPEASSVVSLGVLLAMGLGGLVVSARRRKCSARG